MIKRVALSVGRTSAVPTGAGIPETRKRRDISRSHTSTRPIKQPLQVAGQVDSPVATVPIARRQTREAPHIMIGWERKF